MLGNLRAEIARNDYKYKDIAKALKMDDKSLTNKIQCKTNFTLKEMIALRNMFFKDLTLDYLFEIKERS